ncbi:MAG: hypothetical protein DMG87_19125 [Acidobacteria bacterium]|nr:MAG: hypothetical protein AUH01_03650 [Acidobacteria bacterium 13_2_20CM_56_17]PYX15042.1 MAG: hypothetical protein DMG87_19125 [Acidobacteriota bacterium]
MKIRASKPKAEVPNFKMGKKLRRIALTTSITAENCVRTKLWTNGVPLEDAARQQRSNLARLTFTGRGDNFGRESVVLTRS